ncbi:MAG: HIT domain-containing protein [Proteobacteria bacterium]|nr:HIT domain-containing protein [Pseudomonadota bacterium]
MSPTKKLWAPWRMEYILSDKPSGCVFCPEEPVELKSSLIVYDTNHNSVFLNKFPYTCGHLMVAPKLHTNSLDGLSVEDSSELFSLVKSSIALLREEFNPDGFNVGMNIGKAAGAGIEEHIHMHIVPRWNGDTNFMPVLADTHVVPEHLNDTYDKLRARFIKL